MESRRKARRRSKPKKASRGWILFGLVFFWAACLVAGWEIGMIYWG